MSNSLYVYFLRIHYREKTKDAIREAKCLWISGREFLYWAGIAFFKCSPGALYLLKNFCGSIKQGVAS